MKSILTRGLLVFLFVLFGSAIMLESSHAIVIQNDMDAIQLIDRRVVEPVNDCGNGILEDFEQCDDGDDNGTAGSACRKDCTWDVTEENEDCVRKELVDCLEPDPEVLRRVEAIELVEAVEAAPEPDTTREECIEKAILECRDDEPEPTDEPTEEPQDDPEPDNQTFETTPELFFEGSGGCSLSQFAGGANSLGLVFGMILGLVPMLKRKFK